MSHLRFLLIVSLMIRPLGADTATIQGEAGGANAATTVTVIADADRDGLTDVQEAALGTDPQKVDSDGDGLSDKAEVDGGTNPLVNQFTADPDKVGLRNESGINLAGNLRAAWGFDNMGSGTFLDSSGNAFTAAITGSVTRSAANAGPVSKAAVFPGTGNYLSIAPNVINGLSDKTKLTFSFWYKQAPLSDSFYRTIFSHQLSTGMAVTIAYGIINGVPKMAFIQDFANPASGSNITGVVFVPRVGNDSNTANPAMRLDDNKWHHILVTVNGSSKAIYVDGDFTAPTQSTAVSFSGTGTNTYLGKFSSFNAARGIEGELDQFLIYNRVLTAAELQALWNYDADGDGMSNRSELLGGSNPLLYEDDVDRDGLTNAEETAANGAINFNGAPKVFGVTQANNFDTDGDLFDDYWEAKYFSANVDPNNAAKPVRNGDSDDDGLSNYLEYLNGTNPNVVDTDGDGINDLQEMEFGSDPADISSKPLDPLDYYGDNLSGSYAPIGNLGTVVKAPSGSDSVVVAQIGDPSGTHSEQWALNIGDKRVVADAFGVMSQAIEFKLDPTRAHEIKFQHMATDPTYLLAHGQPDYDYWAAVKLSPHSVFLLCDPHQNLNDPESFDAINENDPSTFHNDADPALLDTQPIYLVPLDNYSWASSYSGGDAVGPKYRKVALNGRPLADEKPQQEEESDLPDEETYVDAFNQSLHHDTTFHYTSLGASDLVLQASASTQETNFSSRSGLRPHERFDLPFGVGWSSNLCSYVEVVETIGDDSNDPVTVNVVDEAGHSQRFGTRNFQSFFPWPSTYVDKKTYLHTLSRNGTDFVLQKKFGNTLTFAKAKTWFMYSTDRVEGSTKIKRHTYWRLTEARDRYGVRLQYDYDNAPGSPNDVALIPRKISSPDREGQFLVIGRSADSRRVESITDSRGHTTTFSYTFTANEYTLPPNNPAGASKLTGIGYADGTTVGYGYESAVETEQDNSDPENVRFTYHYHTNLKSVTDKRGNTHSFTYGFDQSKQYWDSSVSGTECAVPLESLPSEIAEMVKDHLDGSQPQGHAGWKTMYGMQRRVSGVSLPGGGTASFVPQGGMKFGKQVELTPASTTVTDAEGNQTVYEFSGLDAKIVDIDLTEKSVSKEWMVYYLNSAIHHGGLPGSPAYLGTESYAFDPASGLALGSATDLSGNTTTWTFGDAYGAIPAGLPQGSPLMTKWADPTQKVDALNRSETYRYGAYRVMDLITDPFGTETKFDVDALGRRTSKEVRQNGTTLLSRERYDYANSRFKAFQTAKTVVAFSSVSGQTWEKDLQSAFQPDGNGRLWREVADPQGEKLVTEHSYDFNNNKLSTLDPRGNRTRFEYDKLNRLVKVTYPKAGTRNGEAVTTKETWYDFNGNKAAEIDEEGRYTIHHYDVRNRRIKTIRDMDGAGLPVRNAEGLVPEANKGSATGNDLVTTFEYNQVGTLIRQTDPRGVVCRTFVDAIQRPVQVFTGLTPTEAAGTLAACTTAAANSPAKTHTEYKYTNNGLALPRGGTVKGNPGGNAFDSSVFKPTEMIRYGAVKAASGTLDLRTFAQYDALYRPLRTETQYESGTYAVATTTYGAISGGKEALQMTSTDDRGKVTATALDGLQRPLGVTDASGTALAATSSTVYASTGLVWKKIDPLNRQSETEYDGLGRSVKTWQPDPLTGVVNRATPGDPLLGSPCTQTGYDRNGNVAFTVNPLGFRWDYEYDARNRKTVERQPAVTRTEIVNGTPVSTPGLRPVITTAYDGVGTPIASTNARGYVTRSFHDFAYRVTDVLTNPVNGQPSINPASLGANDIRVRTSYDANGNALEVIDGNGNAIRNTYDESNRLTTTATNSVTGQPSANPAAPNSGDITVTNSYDDSGNLVQVKDGENHLTGFRYDGLKRKTRTLWDEGATVQRIEQASFDGVVQLTRTDAKSQVTTYQYDALHRLQNVLYTGASADNRLLDYDLVGNLRNVTYPNETTARQTLRRSAQEFDKLNRLTQETSANATHVHTYDKAGNRRTTTYAGSGRYLASTYDSLNRLATCTEKTSVNAPIGNITSYAYDLAGNVTRKVLPNGSVANSTFDALNRKLGENTLTAGGSLISGFDYTQSAGGFPSGYDAAGSLLKMVETYGHAGMRNRTVSNVYDRCYRLGSETAVETGGATVTTGYTYDAAHNRTAKTVTGGTNPGSWTSVYGTTTDGYNSNQLKSVTKDATITTFQYDANGNRSLKQVGGVTVQTYGYDFENRLVSLADSAKGAFAYTYDHRNRRVGRNEAAAGGSNTELSFAGGLAVQEYASGTSVPAVETIRGSDYGGGIGGVLYTIRGGSNRSYNAYNSRGDVVSQTGDSGAITWQSTYEAFGTRTQEQGATQDRQKANTKDEDPTGLLNEGFRYRDLEFGIFLTRDPAGFVDGPNVYTYVRQNPWTAFDPDGLKKVTIVGGVKTIPDKDHDKSNDHFLQAGVRHAMMEQKALKKSGSKETVSIIIYGPAYDKRGAADGKKDNLQKHVTAAQKAGVDVKVVTSAKDILATAEAMAKAESVSSLKYFGHSNPQKMLLDYGSGDKEAIDGSDITKAIPANRTTKGFTSRLYGCDVGNTTNQSTNMYGASWGAPSMAEVLSNFYKGAEIMGSTGKSRYGDLGQGFISPSSAGGYQYWKNGAPTHTDPSNERPTGEKNVTRNDVAP